jgi:hypothetical protein
VEWWGRVLVPINGQEMVYADYSSIRKLTFASLPNVSFSALGLTRSDPAQTIKVDGTTYSLPVDFTWVPGSTHTVEAPPSPTFSAPPNRFVRFSAWTDGLSNPSRTITAPDSTQQFNYAAAFESFVRFSARAIPTNSGGVSVISGISVPLPQFPQASYVKPGVASMSATSRPGFRLIGWTGIDNGFDLPIVAAFVEQPQSVAA